MKNIFLKSVIVVVGISLLGLVFTQIFWLNNSVIISEKQYDDRADRMLNDVKGELKEFADTSSFIQSTPKDELSLYDVVDTNLLCVLLKKYVRYHRLDSAYIYALVRSQDNSIIYSVGEFTASDELESYKTCLACIWKKEYIHLSVFFPDKRKNIFMEMFSWIFLSVLFILTITAAFVFIIYSIFRQKKISEIKNDFINNMTHEFKTPLSTISLASEMLMKNKNSPASQRIKKYSKIIYEENQRMQLQVDLILQTAIIDKGQLRLKNEMIDFHSLIASAVDGLSFEACEKGVKFDYSLDAHKHKLMADTIHMRNVISNIIDNAIKYSRGDCNIKISTINKDNGLVMSIKDNGIGMDQETRESLFTLFFSSKGNKGTGLGLFIADKIIDQHGGKISVESKRGQGSNFKVTIPRIKAKSVKTVPEKSAAK